MGSALLSQWVEGPEAITVVDPAGSEVPDGVTLVTDRAAIADQRFDPLTKRPEFTRGPAFLIYYSPAFLRNAARVMERTIQPLNLDMNTCMRALTLGLHWPGSAAC